MRLRFGLHYDPRRAAFAGAAPEAVLAALAEHAERADELGIDVLWIAERPTEADALIPAALPVCALLAARTRRARIATGVLPLGLHHPLRVAEDAATLDALSEGRFELGVGLGADREGFPGYGVAPGERTSRLEEAVSLLRGAWADGPVSAAGAHFPIPETRVHPKPVQPGGPPLWIGAGAPEAQRRAARLGSGLFARLGSSPRAFLSAWPETAEAGPRVALSVPFGVACTGRGGATRGPKAARAALRTLLTDGDGADALDLVFPAFPPGLGLAEAAESLEALASVAEALRSEPLARG